MGEFFSKIVNSVSNLFKHKPNLKCLILGLDSAGKTTLIYWLKLGIAVNTVPTVGSNVETIQLKRAIFQMWDLGRLGGEKRLWKHYFTESQAIIFVVDSTDRERIKEAASELDELMKIEELRDAHLLVLANKADLEGSMSVEEVTETMKLQSLNRLWRVYASCCLSGDGLPDGLEWLAESFTQK